MAVRSLRLKVAVDTHPQNRTTYTLTNKFSAVLMIDVVDFYFVPTWLNMNSHLCILSTA